MASPLLFLQRALLFVRCALESLRCRNDHHCTVEVSSIVLEREAKQKLQVPFSENVISSRISDMSNDILNQVIIDIKNSPTKISIQLNESINIVKCCQLLTMVERRKTKLSVKNFCSASHNKQQQLQAIFLIC